MDPSDVKITYYDSRNELLHDTCVDATRQGEAMLDSTNAMMLTLDKSSSILRRNIEESNSLAPKNLQVSFLEAPDIIQNQSRRTFSLDLKMTRQYGNPSARLGEQSSADSAALEVFSGISNREEFR